MPIDEGVEFNEFGTMHQRIKPKLPAFRTRPGTSKPTSSSSPSSRRLRSSEGGTSRRTDRTEGGTSRRTDRKGASGKAAPPSHRSKSAGSNSKKKQQADDGWIGQLSGWLGAPAATGGQSAGSETALSTMCFSADGVWVDTNKFPHAARLLVKAEEEEVRQRDEQRTHREDEKRRGELSTSRRQERQRALDAQRLQWTTTEWAEEAAFKRRSFAEAAAAEAASAAAAAAAAAAAEAAAAEEAAVRLARAGTRYTLILSELRAHNVPDADSKGGSDPYLVVTVEGEDEGSIEASSGRTQPVMNTSQPVWDEELHVALVPDSEAALSHAPRVHIALYDKDLTDADDLIAQAWTTLEGPQGRLGASDDGVFTLRGVDGFHDVRIVGAYEIVPYVPPPRATLILTNLHAALEVLSAHARRRLEAAAKKATAKEQKVLAGADMRPHYISFEVLEKLSTPTAEQLRYTGCTPSLPMRGGWFSQPATEYVHASSFMLPLPGRPSTPTSLPLGDTW